MTDLLFRRLPLGRWFGIPVYLHWSWVLLLLVIGFFSLTQAALFISVFGLVLLHEFGHCLAGRYYNCLVRDVTLYPFGGVAAMEIPLEPDRELVVALSGPAVNVLLFPPLGFLSWVWAVDFPGQLFLCNLCLLVFNLIPAFPMDGGRALRAWLTLVTNRPDWATRVAVRCGQGSGAAFVALGVIFFHWTLVIIGIFVILCATQELNRVRQNEVEESAALLRRLQNR